MPCLFHPNDSKMPFHHHLFLVCSNAILRDVRCGIKGKWLRKMDINMTDGAEMILSRTQDSKLLYIKAQVNTWADDVTSGCYINFYLGV